MTNSSPRSQLSKTPDDRLHHQKDPLLQRLKAASIHKAEGIVEQSPYSIRGSDSGSSSPHPRTKDHHDHSPRIEESVRIQDLDKLVLKRIEEARMSHHDRLRAITTNASNSLFSKGILEYKFPKKFMIRPLITTSVRAT